jgi:hypothetical protein
LIGRGRRGKVLDDGAEVVAARFEVGILVE